MNKFKTAIIGCGRIGSEYDEDSKRKVISSHAGAYYNNKETELVAVCDFNIDRAQKASKKWGAKAYFDVNKMLSIEKLDIISICTWEDTHAEILEKCIQLKPKAIWCEKPISKNIEDAKRMIKLCKANDIKLQVNYMRRFSPFYKEIADFIKSGGIGKIQKIIGHYGDGLMTNGSHLINLVEFFTDEVFMKINAFKSLHKSRYENDANYSFMAETNSGILFSLIPQNNEHYLHVELQIFGEKGSILFMKNGFEVKFFSIQDHELFKGFKELVESDLPFKNKLTGEFMKEALNELIITIKNNKKPICSGEDALKTLKFIRSCINNASKDVRISTIRR